MKNKQQLETDFIFHAIFASEKGPEAQKQEKCTLPKTHTMKRERIDNLRDATEKEKIVHL